MDETSRQFFELTQSKGWIKSVDVLLPRSWQLEKCHLTDKTVTQKRIPTRDETDIIIHGKTKRHKEKFIMCHLWLMRAKNTPTLISNFLTVFISGEQHHTFGSVPWPQQFGECGQKGAKLHVPYSFLENLRGNLRRKCKAFYLNKIENQSETASSIV